MMNKQDIILNDAFKAYNSGDFSKAESLAREVLTVQPSHGDALYLLGLLAYQAGALEPAVELLFQAVQLYPRIENYTLTLASILQRQGRLEEALSYYQKFPKNSKGLSQIGFVHLQQKEYDKAEESFTSALEITSNLPEAQLGLAICHQDEELLKKVAEISNIPDAWYYLSKMYLDKGNLEEALSTIDKTGMQQPAYMVQKGIILEALGQDDDALSIYKAAAHQDPYRSDVWTNQANLFKKKGEYAAAEDYYKRALAQDFDDIASRHNLADLLYKEKRIAEALEQYRAVLIRKPDNIETLFNLAIILEETGEYAEAAGLYFKLLLVQKSISGLDWRISNTLLNLAQIGKDGFKLAKDFVRGWIKNFPDNPVVKHTFATLMGEKETNIKSYIKALFNDFAESYDSKMTELKAIAIEETISLIPQKKYTDILDLGCGTGAFASHFSGEYKTLTGVDLSEEMINQASKTNKYTSLVTNDVLAFLKKNNKKYDLITAIELLGYMPTLTQLFKEIATHLKTKGIFVFTVETTPQYKSILSINGRYLYPSEAITKALSKNGLHIKEQKLVHLRREGKGYADGLVILAQK